MSEEQTEYSEGEALPCNPEAESIIRNDPTKTLRSESSDPWSNRPSTMKCLTCMWFVRKEGRGTRLGRCRRHAPTMNGYPVVYTSDWCGDHKMNENTE